MTNIKRRRRMKGGYSSTTTKRNTKGQIYANSKFPSTSHIIADKAIFNQSTPKLPSSSPPPPPSADELQLKNEQSGGDSEKVFFARFAKAVYEPLDSRVNILDFEYLPNYSDANTGTWINHSKKMIIIAFRGTDFKNWRDLAQDLLIVGGISIFSARYVAGVHLVKKVESNFPDYNISLTGHSLGGKIGLNIGTKLQKKAVLFNIGSSPADKPKDILYSTICKLLDLNSCKGFKKITHYHVNGDPLSASAANITAFKTIRQKPTGLDPHGIDNFIPLK